MMQEYGPIQFGKLLIFLGLILIIAGVMVMILSKFGFFRLPGDIEWGSKNWRIYLPIVSCLVLSVFLTLIMWIVQYFRK